MDYQARLKHPDKIVHAKTLVAPLPDIELGNRGNDITLADRKYPTIQ
jgi:hypothetical protein